MRIAFAYNFSDTDWIGGRNYFASLFRSLHSVVDGNFQLVFVTGKRTLTTLPDEFPFLEVHRTALMDRNRPLWLLRQLGLRTLDADPLLARHLRRLRVDLLSHSGYLGNNPGLKTLPWLFDFQFMHLHEHWTRRQFRWVVRRYASACKQGDGVIVSSEDALNDLSKFMPNAQIPIHVLRFVSNPVDLRCLPSLAALRERYGLMREYFHLPNQFWTHKNHRVVIDALGLLKARGVEAQVVCTGSKSDIRSPRHFEDLMVRRKALAVEDNFKVLGLVPYVDMQALMAHSIAVINPSSFEGWSTTVEEAKTLHKRLLLSDLAVHREQAPMRGQFFKTDDADALATLMQQCLETPQLESSEAEIAESYRRRSNDFAYQYLQIVQATVR